MTKDEVIKLAMHHQVDGCLSHNLRIIVFANAIADLQREKDAKICESLETVLHPAQVITDRCAAAIRANKE